MSANVLVIGGGVAGCMAAASAVRAGASVTMVSRSVGATALSSGAVMLDGLDGWPGGKRDLAEVLEVLGSLVPLSGDPSSRRTYLSSSGALASAHLVMPGHAAGALEGLAHGSVLCLGLRGFGGWHAGSMSRRLEASGIRAGHATVVVEGLSRDWDLSAFAIAQYLDEPEARGRLSAAFAAEASKGAWEAVALPPVMGLESWREVGEQLDASLGRPWFETLSTLPSVPGNRFHRSLQSSVRALGVTMLHAEVTRSFIDGGGRVVRLEAQDGETVHVLEPDSIVLATGRFVSGGLVLAERTLESVLDLPVRQGQGAGRDDGMMLAGVDVGEDMRPRDVAGRVTVTNVLVAGSLLHGADCVSGRAGIGLAAVTGMRAGVKAAAASGIADRGGAGRLVSVVARPGIEGCLGCEVCASVCPVLRQSTIDGPWYPGPRSVGNLGRSGPIADVSADPLSLCTLCGACSTVCPAGGKNHETVAALRADLVARRPETTPEAWRAIPRVLAEAGNVYGTTLEPLEGPRRKDSEVAFFPGCSLLYFERESGARTLRLLESFGLPVSVVDGVCCGGPLDVLGLEPRAEAVERNREAVRATGAKVVIATCPRCAHRLSRDLQLPGVRVEQALESVARLLPGSRVLGELRAKLGGRKVTYHDPCETGRYLGRYEQARDIMRMVGLELIEMEHTRERSECCGAGGGLRSVNSKLSREISRRRVSEALDTGALALLTECPSCMHNLRTGRKRKQNLEVEDLTAFLGQSV